MKALIIRKKWLDKIFDEGKIWEMRSRPTNTRGTIQLIEAGTGLIVGQAKLITCMPPIDDFDSNIFFYQHKIEDIHLLKKWKYPWVIKFAKRYKKPIPYKHPKGAVIWVNINDVVS